MDGMLWPAGPAGADPATGRVGTTLCGWTIERSLGGGPVCASFLGVRGSDRAVVRVLREPFAADADARAEWVRASWAANRFHHSRVVKVLDQGADERGAPVVVRAWAKGDPLHEAARIEPLDSAAALRLAEQMLDALETAHAHGIVHGALGPTNVVVTPRRTVRLLDFATAPGLFTRRSDSSPLLASARRSGAFVPPERRGTPPDVATERSDVWGVGACLYFVLTGEAPPLEAEARDVSARAGLSADVAAVVALAIGRDPTRRYESAYAMLGDVRRVLAGQRPRLDASLVAVPSQRALPLPSSFSGELGLQVTQAPSPAARDPQWRGNLVLVVAIALLVGVATFVLMRERIAERPQLQQEAPSSAETR
jgi:serine/threonine-protein kinase